MTKPSNPHAWITAIELPNNSSFVTRLWGGAYLFGATPYSAASVQRETGGNMVRVGSVEPDRGPDEEPPMIYWVIGDLPTRALRNSISESELAAWVTK